MNVQPFIDSLFDQWLLTHPHYNKDSSIIKGFGNFKRDLLQAMRDSTPSRFNEPNISNQLKVLEWITIKGERPYVWDGELGTWFNEKLKANTISGKLSQAWNQSFNPMNEYKEWYTLYNREPKLTKIVDPSNKLGIKGGGNLSKLEHRLATWANQVKQLNLSNSLTDEKHKQIDDTLGSWFDWNCIIDTIGSNKKRRQEMIQC